MIWLFPNWREESLECERGEEGPMCHHHLSGPSCFLVMNTTPTGVLCPPTGWTANQKANSTSPQLVTSGPLAFTAQPGEAGNFGYQGKGVPWADGSWPVFSSLSLSAGSFPLEMNTLQSLPYF